MRTKVLVHAVVGITAAFAASGEIAVAHAGAESSPTRAHSTRSSSVADSTFRGVSGKLRGPLFTFLKRRPFSEKNKRTYRSIFDGLLASRAKKY
jgi:hypothetical protein